jgi:hypothetical protein
MNSMKSFHRLAVLALSLIIIAAFTGIIGKAAVTIVTPNSATVNYTLAAGATSSPVAPATNQPVMVIGANIGTTDFAVSTVTLVHIPGTMLRWVGIEAATGVIVHNGSAALGTHIIWLDNSNKVALQVFSADQFVIHNGSTGTQSGSVKLIW